MTQHGSRTLVGGSAAELRLLGGVLCLDFANTLDPRRGPRPRDFLASYGDLATWATHAGIVSTAQRARLAALAESQPHEAARVLDGATALREAIYRAFAALAAGAAPRPADLEAIGAARGRAAAHERIVPDPAGGFAWAWDGHPDALDRMLWPIARSAADLLTAGRLDRVRECPGADDCGWLFLDTSKNGSRRWCSMEGCGNLAKSRRFAARHAVGAAGSPP